MNNAQVDIAAASDDNLTGTEAFINVLAHLQHPHPPLEVGIATINDDLKAWSHDQLRSEIIRLRQIISQSHLNTEDSTSPSGVDLELNVRPIQAKRGRQSIEYGQINHHSNGVESKKVKVERDQGTGKRLEKGRKTELGKAIRTKVRDHLNNDSPNRTWPSSCYQSGSS